MTVKDLERLYDYGYWANKKLLTAVAQLAPEQFTKTVAGSYGSVRNTGPITVFITGDRLRCC